MRRFLGLLVIIAGGVAPVLEATTFVAQAPAQQVGGSALPAQTSLAQAIGVAEQRTGGRARKADWERERGIGVYEIKTVSKEGSAEVLVDAASGNVVRVATPWFANVFDREDHRKDQAAFAQLSASAATLMGAIDAAEKAAGGRAVKAEFKSRYGSALFEVSVIKDWTKQKVLVDAATGRVVAVSPQEAHNDDD